MSLVRRSSLEENLVQKTPAKCKVMEMIPSAEELELKGHGSSGKQMNEFTESSDYEDCTETEQNRDSSGLSDETTLIGKFDTFFLKLKFNLYFF